MGSDNCTTKRMEGLTNAVVSTPGVTFTYAPADIQGLADTSQPVRANLGGSPSSLQIGPSRGGGLSGRQSRMLAAGSR